MPILFQIFLCSVTGATVNQIFYFVGLNYTTATVACALNNVLPAATFVLAAIFRQEAVGIKKASGVAKVLGTLICVGGAMLLSFYHGHIVGIGESKVHWNYADKMSSNDSSGTIGSNSFLGPFLVMASAIAWAVWFILQGQTSKNFPAPYTCTTIMCFMASIECTIIGIFSEHKPSAWSLSSPMRLIAALYAGIICNAVAFCVMSWCIQIRGPLYVSVFSPLLLVIVAILSWVLLREKLYVGTVIGSLLIVGGLYAVLWGKDKEMKHMNAGEKGGEGKVEVTKAVGVDNDLELQLQPPLKGSQLGG
ncbi:WAT1-related protein At1g09380-like [Hibiscus syriacus]|nr:WAT1-related protein At1g09380-like [Hibiscus syriacus]